MIKFIRKNFSLKRFTTENQLKTIFSLSSGSIPSGVSVIRVSGVNSKKISNKITTIKNLEPNKATYTNFIDPETKEVIDKGYLLFFKSPKSFTGEDIIELHTHGSIAVINEMIRILSNQENCRLAERGEFTKRAFINNKLDLTQVEGLKALISSQTKTQLKNSQQEYSGELGKKYKTWRSDLMTVLSYGEAVLDFSEQDHLEFLEDFSFYQFKINLIKKDIDKYLKDSLNFKRMINGYNVVITGPPNAGKSSLYNSILKQNRALVSSIAGTTRDYLASSFILNGDLVNLIDTAGIHDTNDKLESLGIEKTKEILSTSDLTLLLIESGDCLKEVESVYKDILKPPIWLILNKIDKQKDEIDLINQSKEIKIDNKIGINSLTEEISNQATKKEAIDHPIISSERQQKILKDSSEHLSNVLLHREMDELWVEDVRILIKKLNELLGDISTEEVLDEIFSQFCIGK